MDSPAIPDEFKSEPKIMLAGKEWACPPMSGRSILKFLSMADTLQVGKGMPASDMEKLYEAVHIGLKRVYPEMTFDQFMELPVMPDEIMLAFKIVAKAAGMDTAKIAGGAPGEAQAEGPSTSSADSSSTQLATSA